MKRPLISILMPTYNDADFIQDAINSVIKQTYANWELIIINDGSYDQTDSYVQHYLTDRRIHYIKLNSNQGQLNAIDKGCAEINGDYVTFLHSDDKYNSENVLHRLTSEITANGIDGLFADLIKIDENTGQKSLLKTVKNVTSNTVISVFSLRGSNCVSDVFFLKKDIFFNYVYNRYIQWNLPYWYFPANKRIKTLNLKKVNPWYIYRISNNNMLCSEAGKYESISGKLRTAIELAQYFDIPFYSISRIVPILTRLIFNRPYTLAFEKRYSKPFSSFINIIIEQYYKNKIKNLHLSSLISYYENYSSTRKINVSNNIIYNDFNLYYGKDARKFYQKMQKNQIPSLHKFLLDEATHGYKAVIVDNTEDIKIVRTALYFLNINANVELKK